MPANTITLAWGDDMIVVDASASQIKQGAEAFVRSATLTVDGQTPKPSAVKSGFRLNAVQMAALLASDAQEGVAGSITLPLVKRGRPVKGGGSLAARRAAAAPAAAVKARRSRRS